MAYFQALYHWFTTVRYSIAVQLLKSYLNDSSAKIIVGDSIFEVLVTMFQVQGYIILNIYN